MEDLKMIIAKNIASLRKAAELTQFELAEQLNYSDKAVSKWERGESIPDIIVLKQIADMFSVSVDYLLVEDHDKKKFLPDFRNIKFLNHGFITGMAITLVWLIALVVFVVGDLFREQTMYHHLLVFLFAVPCTFIVWLVFNSIWFNSRRNFLIISLLMWSGLLTIHISVLVILNINIRFIFLLGIPGQIIIFFWSKLKVKKNKENEDRQ